MKGYKALNKNMKTVYDNTVQYEIGKLYSAKGEVIPFQNGFDFCSSIENLNAYYSIKDSRVFEVEAYGENMEYDDTYAAYATEKIKLVRELTEAELSDYFKQNQKEFIKDGEGFARRAVAEYGYGLEVLIEDEDWHVRKAVAEQGYGLEVLIEDEDWHVRKAVAEQGYGLDILINDENSPVRFAVAKWGYGLDKLINDDHWNVRSEVARQGYGLDILIKDKNSYVRHVAQETLRCAE